VQHTGFLGIASTKCTPPSSRLALLTRSASQLFIPSADSGVALSGDWGTIYARGASSPFLRKSDREHALKGARRNYQDTPMTATSWTSGCSRSRASSSAGATWSPFTLINSCRWSVSLSSMLCYAIRRTFLRSTMNQLFSLST
jgi:hypothetical protein